MPDSPLTPDPSDPLLASPPTEDAGAITAHLYEFQHHCALRMLLTAASIGIRQSIVCETHEDMLVLDDKGRVLMAVSVKHREAGSPWSRAELISAGGVPKLHQTWEKSGRRVMTALMSNARLEPGESGGAGLLEAEKAAQDKRAAQWQWLAQRLDCDVPQAADFLRLIRHDTGLPARSHIGVVQRVQLLEPLLTKLELPVSFSDRVYAAALGLVRERSTDRDPLSHDVRLAMLLEPGDRARFEHQARVQSRTVTTEELVDVLRATAAGAGPRLAGAPTDMSEPTTLKLKLRAGGLPRSAEYAAANRRASWYAVERRYEGLTELEEHMLWLRTRVAELAADAEKAARETDADADYGAQMQHHLRELLEDGESALAAKGVSAELREPALLEGCAYQLTDECHVYWSSKQALRELREQEHHGR